MKRLRGRYEKMSVFEQVMTSLREGLAHARGEVTLRTTTVPEVEEVRFQEHRAPGRKQKRRPPNARPRSGRRT